MLCWFPDFLVKYHVATQTIFLGPGPIQIDERYYIAILACSNFGCEYLHSRLSQQFLYIGGSIEWLEVGIEKANEKIQALANLNSKLAFQPEEVFRNPSMLQELREKGWQKNELIQAVFILSYYHGLACACIALGLKSELDLKNSNIILLSKAQTPIGSNMTSPRENNSIPNPKSFNFANEAIEKILKGMSIKEDTLAEDEDQSQQSEDTQKKICSNNLLKEESASSSPMSKDTILVESTKTGVIFEKYKKYIPNPIFSDERIVQTLRYSDFNFNAHGYQITNQYASELAQSFINLFHVVKTMTNKNLNSIKGLSTFPFRKAIRLYIQNIFGYTHYDADYKTEMNALLPIPLKTFLKLTVKQPYAIKLENIQNINLELMPSEFAHIILIAIHARVEIELVYFLSPFQKF